MQGNYKKSKLIFFRFLDLAHPLIPSLPWQTVEAAS